MNPPQAGDVAICPALLPKPRQIHHTQIFPALWAQIIDTLNADKYPPDYVKNLLL